MQRCFPFFLDQGVLIYLFCLRIHYLVLGSNKLIYYLIIRKQPSTSRLIYPLSSFKSLHHCIRTELILLRCLKNDARVKDKSHIYIYIYSYHILESQLNETALNGIILLQTRIITLKKYLCSSIWCGQ